MHQLPPPPSRRRRQLIKLFSALGVGGVSWLPSTAWALLKQINAIRLYDYPEKVQLEFALDGEINHRLFVLENPERVVLDLKNVKLQGGLPAIGEAQDLVKNLRAGIRNGNDLRVVLNTQGAHSPEVAFLPPSQGKGPRLSLSVFRAVVKIPDNTRIQSPEPQRNQRQPLQSDKLRDVVVVIDAGHGGKDPGAVGRKGTKEKDIMLAVGRKLAHRLGKQRGVKPVLVRSSDKFVPLRSRLQKARSAKADIFISLHADGFKHPSASGSSVYILSPRGASSEAARWLAKKENSAGLIGGGVNDNPSGLPELVLNTLIDMHQSHTIEASYQLGKKVLSRMGQVNHLHKKTVERAGFVVLKSPDIPSLLVETAFITNPSEEKKLRTSRYQHQMADAIYTGVMDYFRKEAPPGTYLSALNDKQFS